MSRSWTGYLAGAAFALSAAASAAAYAQPAPAEGGENGARSERHERVMVVRHEDQAKHRAEHLSALLQLKPGQEPALTAYLAAMTPDHDAMMGMADQEPAKTTPERLAQMERHMTEHEALMRRRMDATRRFYDQLDPGQKRAFDELPSMMGGHGDMMAMMGRKMMMMHHGMGPMPPVPPMAPVPPAPPRS